jgi:hypothetical protein
MRPDVLALDRSFAAGGGAVRRYDADGRLRVSSANISKAVVSPYRGEEIPGWQDLGLDPRRTYQLLRHPNELKKAARTFDGLPVLIRHVPVSAADHPRELVVGTLGTDTEFDGTYLRSSLTVWTRGAIDAIESGARRELSCGYAYRPKMRPSIFQGRRYDGVMTEITGNHCALVDTGRVGSDCSL